MAASWGRRCTTTYTAARRSSASRLSRLVWRTTARFSGASTRHAPRRFRCWMFPLSTKMRSSSMCGAPVSTTARSSGALTVWISRLRTTTWLTNLRVEMVTVIPLMKLGMYDHACIYLLKFVSFWCFHL